MSTWFYCHFQTHEHVTILNAYMRTRSFVYPCFWWKLFCYSTSFSDCCLNLKNKDKNIILYRYSSCCFTGIPIFHNYWYILWNYSNYCYVIRIVGLIAIPAFKMASSRHFCLSKSLFFHLVVCLWRKFSHMINSSMVCFIWKPLTRLHTTSLLS